MVFKSISPLLHPSSTAVFAPLRRRMLTSTGQELRFFIHYQTWKDGWYMSTVATLSTRLLLVSSLLLSGCAAIQTAGEVQSGRRALLTHNPEQALGYFQKAAARSPDYRYVSHTLQQTVWTYLGRALY
jgi:hypothetical protein